MHGTFILVWEKILQFSADSRLFVATEWSLSEEVEVRVDPVICTFRSRSNCLVITFRDKLPGRIFIDLLANVNSCTRPVTRVKPSDNFDLDLLAWTS